MNSKQGRFSTMAILVRLCCLLGIIIAGVSGEYCSSYYDSTGSYVSGFDCPTWIDSWDKTYCCGSSTYKYCCDYSTQQWDGFDYWGDASDVVGLGISIILGIVFGIIGLIVLIIVGIVLCVCCCAKASSGTKTTTTHVVQNPTVHPTVVSYSSQGGQPPQYGYNAPPPAYGGYATQPPPPQPMYSTQPPPPAQPMYSTDDPAYPPEKAVFNPAV